MRAQLDVAVIVPAIMGVGLLFSVGAVARDVVRRVHGHRLLERRATLDGRSTALVTTHGLPAALRDRSGLRPRRTYAVAGLFACGLAIYGAIGSVGNFVGLTPWSEGVAWVLALLLGVSTAFGVVGAAALLVAVRFERPPAWARRLLTWTPLTVVEHVAGRRERQRLEIGPVRPLGPHHVSDRVAGLARGVAAVWAVLATLSFAVLASTGRMPQAIDGSAIESDVAAPVQWALLSLVGVGTLVAARREALGAVVIAVTGTAMAIMAGIQYPPPVAVGVSLVFFVPAFLHWLAWQRDRHVRQLFRLFAATVVLIGGVWVGADRVYAHYFGPTHPASTAPVPEPSTIEWAWAGGTSPEQTTVVARLRSPHDRVRITLATRSDFSDARSSPWSPADTRTHLVVRATFTGLRPDTTYHYAVESAEGLDLVRAGSVRTFPLGAADFSVAFGSCARTGSDGAVFDAIRSERALAYISTGDLHYANVARNDERAFRAALDSSLGSPSQSALYRSTTVGYVWDDHDYAANDANEDAVTRPAAQAVYRQYVPHFALPGGERSGPIHQAFSIGRVRFLMTDNRSTRSPQTAVDDAAKHMLGPDQEQWLVRELTAARGRGEVVVWVNPSPWIGAPVAQADTWAGYATQRSRIADAIADTGMADRLVMVSGDAHMLAVDDGTHTDYSSRGAGGFPLIQAAPLDRPPGVKGGPYTDGPFLGVGQYGVLTVRDDGGDSVTVRLRGRTWDHRTVVDRTFTLEAGG